MGVRQVEDPLVPAFCRRSAFLMQNPIRMGPKEIDGREAGEISKERTEKISIIACCQHRCDPVKKARRYHDIRFFTFFHFFFLFLAWRHLKTGGLQYQLSEKLPCLRLSPETQYENCTQNLTVPSACNSISKKTN